LVFWAVIFIYGTGGVAAIMSRSSGPLVALPVETLAGISATILPLALRRMLPREDSSRLPEQFVVAVMLSSFVGFAAGLGLANAFFTNTLFIRRIVAFQLMDGIALLLMGSYYAPRHAPLLLMGITLLLAGLGYSFLPDDPSGPAGPYLLGVVGISHAAGAMFYLGRRTREGGLHRAPGTRRLESSRVSDKP
jgi:hypothetical protein